MTYRKVRTLDQADAGYIAGLIDGEGTITLSRRNRNKNRGLVVTICNTERAILEYIQEAIGLGKITNKRTTGANHSPSYTYNISNRQALALLNQIVPFLRSHKYQRALLVLKEYVRLTPRNGRYTKTQVNQREAFVREFFAIRSSHTTGRQGLMFP